MTATDIAIVGVGKIARDQHIPSITKNDAFRLAATVSRHSEVDGVENFATIEELLEQRPDIPAVALCMPPQNRFDAAWTAIKAGRHVLLEKPPGATIAEVQALVEAARDKGVALFATWHSRYAAAVPSAKAWLAERKVESARITWKEDVRRWHPGQEWIWQPGGLGVFDPGINALSILTEILPQPVRVTSAELEFPEGRDAPIGAQLQFAGASGETVSADFDWRQTGPQTWDIDVLTNDGTLKLSSGGAEMTVDQKVVIQEADSEYDGIYARFATVVAERAIDVDLAPLVHVADAFMLGRRIAVDAFDM
ncbi:Gfo/Idh/MocA family protein [Tianweitania populi]|uniref:D-galactose 1-dehydrogenase n=1 Tax=Tianweitania populi TaxID=1607949 RepID=A0A8J3GMF1_9HYPH|nr:Gfo/Idh/MocA family oxidoreductase [Tianweitania populi]GHD22827.1 D-galactose 1-dehydrogenase [Tianweitania populi]